MTCEAGQLTARAADAVGRGEVGEAVALLGEALAREDRPDAHELLGALNYADDRMDAVCAEWSAAFRGFRALGRPADAARVATRLGEVHWSILGNHAAGRGWLERARRLLEQAGPCVEWGYLDLALIGCDRPDVDELLASAERARLVALDHGDAGLEVRALADGGLALVSQGRIEEGFRRLDEALVGLSDVHDRYIIGTTLCALLSSCDRAGDASRATELVRLTHDVVLGPAGGRPKVLGTHCNVAYGGVLCAAGRWSEAERVVLDALGPEGSVSVVHRVEATARLAEMRVHQGRIDEAVALLSPYEDHPSAGGALALVHVARGDHALARAVLARTVAQLVGDVLRGAPLLGLVVECDLALGDHPAADDAARLLDAMAAAVDVALVAVLAAQARARIALAEGHASVAVSLLCRARRDLAAVGRPLVEIGVHLDLASAHAGVGDRAAAVDSARAAHAAAVRVSAPVLRDRAAAALRELGTVAPRPASPGASMAGLTARELEVLDGIRRGETNAEIAATLYVSAKTVEHHVSRVLAKLGVRSRAEAAAVSAATPTTGSGGK